MSKGKWAVVMVAVCLVAVVAVGSSAVAESTEGSAEPAQPAPITIVAPEAGCVANVGDVLDVLLVVRDGLEVASVAVLCDARGVGMLQSPPYTFKWDTRGLEPGEHIVRAFVYLKSGEKLGAVPIVVTLTQSQKPEPVKAAVTAAVLKEGTLILLQTQEKMVSGQVAEGAPVRYKIARDVVGPGGKLLVAYGDFAEGRVTRSRRRGMFGKAGQLEFTVDSATAVDGTRVPLRSSQQMAGKDNKGTVIATALLLSVFTVFIHGKDVELPAGTELAAYVDHDTGIGAPQDAPAGGVLRGEPEETVAISGPVPGQTFASDGTIQVTVTVTPERKFALARFYSDGKQMAMLERELKPLSLSASKVGAGEHQLEAEVQFLNGRIVRSAPVRIKVRAPGS
jgi:hypothetical protein